MFPVAKAGSAGALLALSVLFATEQPTGGDPLDIASMTREHRVLEPLPPSFSRFTDRARWHRSLAPTHRALRLLVGFGAAFDLTDRFLGAGRIGHVLDALETDRTRPRPGG